MTALARLIPRWLRGPWVADDPAPDLSWLDRADGRTDPLPALPRDWLDDLPSGDLAAMAAPLTEVDRFVADVAEGMARDDLGTYAEPVTVHITADTSEFRATMDRFASAVSMDMIAWDTPPAEPVTVGEWTAPVPFVPAVEPMPRHAFERIMADLDLLERAEHAFADGRAYESGSRCRTEAAAMKRAAEHLAEPDGARRAALVLAGFTGAGTLVV
jgi:hypothetical protein